MQMSLQHPPRKGKGSVGGQEWARPIRQKMPQNLIAAKMKALELIAVTALLKL